MKIIYKSGSYPDEVNQQLLRAVAELGESYVPVYESYLAGWSLNGQYWCSMVLRPVTPTLTTLKPSPCHSDNRSAEESSARQQTGNVFPCKTFSGSWKADSCHSETRHGFVTGFAGQSDTQPGVVTGCARQNTAPDQSPNQQALPWTD